MGRSGSGLRLTIFTAVSDRKLDEQLAQAGAQLTDAQADAAHGILAGTESGLQVQQQFPDIAGELERFVREAFVTGFNWGLRVDSILAFVGVVIAAVFVGERLRKPPHGVLTRYAAVAGAMRHPSQDERIIPSDLKRAPRVPKSSRESVDTRCRLAFE